MNNNINLSKPIFVLGNNRSGTSLLRLMLHHHSQISIPPESHFFLWLEVKYSNWNNAKLNNYIEDLFNATKFETWNITKKGLLSFLKNNTIKSYAELTSLVYCYYALENSEKPIRFWGDKNSLWIDKLNTIRYHYPEAFFIHLVRDGRDVACSYKSIHNRIFKSKYAPKLPNDIQVIAELWKKNVNSVDDFFDTIDKTNNITLRYEDLITKPEQVLKQILIKISLSFEEKQLNYFKTPISEIEPLEFLKWKKKLKQPLDVNNIGKYKVELTEKEIDLFNNKANSTLRKYYYL